MSVSLLITIEPQKQSEWCWAAVTSTVDHYYDATSSWTQCSLANNQLHQTTCCVAGSSKQCNQPWDLQRSLGLVGRLRIAVETPALYDGIQQEIDEKHPLCVRIGWPDGQGHAVIIYGYDDAIGYVFVGDPIFGITKIPYASFLSHYQGDGQWTDSYFTEL
jgi:Papain-like cysteine protease AvrRpt2